MSVEQDSLLVRALKDGPAFLLLGQGYARLHGGTDEFLAAVQGKFGGQGQTHDALLASEAGDSPESALAWMHSLCLRLLAPVWLETVASFAWSGVYCSAIDSIWQRPFRLEWRELQSVFSDGYKPVEPRNRLVLHCTYLYGGVSRGTNEEERPPLTSIELSSRRFACFALLRRLPELITPKGVLVVEGYLPNEDWLAVNDILAVVNRLNVGQVHVFSFPEDLLNSPDVAAMISLGKLVRHQESLASFLVRCAKAGMLRLGAPDAVSPEGHRVTVDGQQVHVPISLWNQVSRSATVLDDSVVEELRPLSGDRLYVEFRRFLEESSARPVWSGIARGMNFRRDYEEQLDCEVARLLSLKTLTEEPIVLHGQTGTGKTVALAALAFSIRREGRHPVLFIERRTRRPSIADVDAFCQHMEQAGAPTSLLVWDGMLDPEQYSDFLRQMNSLGRKMVLVGSSYSLIRGDQDPRTSAKRTYVNAPSSLQGEEPGRFVTFLRQFGDVLAKYASRYDMRDRTYLVALYRLLPPTRSAIRDGVLREMGSAEQTMRGKVAPSAETRDQTPFGDLLRTALLETRPDLLSSAPPDTGGDVAATRTDLLTGLVMVPGRFGVKVPVELVLRSLGAWGFENLMRVCKAVDVFRWYEDSQGAVFIGPRHPLEADQIVRARYGGPKTELEFISKLLLEIRDDDFEISFAVELSRSVLRDGTERNTYFAPWFRELAGTLRSLRTERGVSNPRLMLQEANALKEWVQSCALKSDAAGVKKSLDEAEEVLRSALDLVSTAGPRANPLRPAILVELASTLGTGLTYDLREGTGSWRDVVALFSELKEYAFQARREDPSGYYPLDVIAWTTLEFLGSDNLDPVQRAEAEADLLYALESVQLEDLPSVQRERYDARRMQAGGVLADAALTDDAFEALAAQGSCAGYYLRACALGGGVRRTTRLDPGPMSQYLQEHRAAINKDSRCLKLLLRAWWEVAAGSLMFASERRALGFSSDQWQYCLGALADLEFAGGLDTPRHCYLKGLALFHVGRVQDSIDVFSELQHDSSMRSSRRVVRSYLASDEGGRPRQYNGTVKWCSSEGRRGQVYVEELGRPIAFIPQEFSGKPFQVGEEIDGFHIAFNFLGPIAEPGRYYHPSR